MVKLINITLFFFLLIFSSLVAEAKRPNILFLFSDDQRSDTIRALGNRHIITPNLDRLVREGITFNQAYNMGSLERAVCVPSRAMLMSGKSLFNVSSSLEGTTTWPKVLSREGYRTFGIGKWHNGQKSFINTFDRGKDIFFGGMNNPYTMEVRDLDVAQMLGPQHKVQKHAVESFTDTAIEFLQKEHGDQPFALYIAYTLPHDPRIAPKEYRAMYDPTKLPLPKNFLPEHSFDNGEMEVRDEKLAPWPRTPEIIREHLADYYASITYLDAQIGRILDALKQTGEYDNTIIVFASDHGLAIGSHGLMGKQNLYEHSTRTPLIIAGPGIPKNVDSDALCYLYDLFPTLCDLTGIKTPLDINGVSLIPIINQKEKNRRNSIFTAYRNFQRAVRDNRWKLIVYPQINKTQLFDLKNDPNEMRDLARNPKYAGRLKKMTLLLNHNSSKHLIQ